MGQSLLKGLRGAQVALDDKLTNSNIALLGASLAPLREETVPDGRRPAVQEMGGDEGEKDRKYSGKDDVPEWDEDESEKEEIDDVIADVSEDEEGPTREELERAGAKIFELPENKNEEGELGEGAANWKSGLLLRAAEKNFFQGRVNLAEYVYGGGRSRAAQEKKYLEEGEDSDEEELFKLRSKVRFSGCTFRISGGFPGNFTEICC